MVRRRLTLRQIRKVLSSNPPKVDEARFMTLEGHLSPPPEFLYAMDDVDMPYDAITLLAIHTHLKAVISDRRDYDAYWTYAYNSLGHHYFDNEDFEEVVFWCYAYFHQCLLSGNWIDPDNDFINITVMLANAHVYGSVLDGLSEQECEDVLDLMTTKSKMHGTHWMRSSYEFSIRYQRLYENIVIYNNLGALEGDELESKLLGNFHIPPHMWNYDDSSEILLEDEENLDFLIASVAAVRNEDLRYAHFTEERDFYRDYVLSGNDIDEEATNAVVAPDDVPSQWYIAADEYSRIVEQFPEYFTSRLHEEYKHLVRYYGTRAVYEQLTPNQFKIKGNLDMALSNRYENTRERSDRDSGTRGRNSRSSSRGRTTRSSGREERPSRGRATSRGRTSSRSSAEPLNRRSRKRSTFFDASNDLAMLYRSAERSINDEMRDAADLMVDEIVRHVDPQDWEQFIMRNLLVNQLLSEEASDLEITSREEVEEEREETSRVRSRTGRSVSRGSRSRGHDAKEEEPRKEVAPMPSIRDAFKRYDETAKAETSNSEEHVDLSLVNTASIDFIMQRKLHEKNGLPTDTKSVYLAFKQKKADEAYERLNPGHSAVEKEVEEEPVVAAPVSRTPRRPNMPVRGAKTDFTKSPEPEVEEVIEEVDEVIHEPTPAPVDEVKDTVVHIEEEVEEVEAPEVAGDEMTLFEGTTWPVLNRPDFRLSVIERAAVEDLTKVYGYEGVEDLVTRRVMFFAPKNTMGLHGFDKVEDGQVCPVVGTQQYWSYFYLGTVRAKDTIAKSLHLGLAEGEYYPTGENYLIAYDYKDLQEVIPGACLENISKPITHQPSIERLVVQFDMFGRWVFHVIPKEESEMQDYVAHQNHPDWADPDAGYNLPTLESLFGGYGKDLATTVNPTIDDSLIGLTDEKLTARDALSIKANDVHEAVTSAETILRKKNPLADISKQILEVTYNESKSFFVPTRYVNNLKTKLDFLGDMDNKTKKGLDLVQVLDAIPAAGKSLAYIMTTLTQYVNAQLYYGIGTDVYIDDIYSDHTTLVDNVVKREGNAFTTSVEAILERVKLFALNLVDNLVFSECETDTGVENEANQDYELAKDWYLEVNISNMVTSVPWSLKAMGIQLKDLRKGLLVNKSSDLYKAIDSVFERGLALNAIKEHAMLLNDGNVIQLMRAPTGVKNYMIYE